MLQSLTGNSCVRLIQSNKSAWYFFFLVLGYILYLIFGAVVFSSVELPYEDRMRQRLLGIKRQFLQEHQCLSEERLEEFLSKAFDASNYGVSILNNASASWNWDFMSSLFFASTVLSTTGKWLRNACNVSWKTWVGKSEDQHCPSYVQVLVPWHCRLYSVEYLCDPFYMLSRPQWQSIKVSVEKKHYKPSI